MKLAFKLMEDAGIPQDRAKPEGRFTHMHIAIAHTWIYKHCGWSSLVCETSTHEWTHTLLHVCVLTPGAISTHVYTHNGIHL